MALQCKQVTKEWMLLQDILGRIELNRILPKVSHWAESKALEIVEFVKYTHTGMARNGGRKFQSRLNSFCEANVNTRSLRLCNAPFQIGNRGLIQTFLTWVVVVRLEYKCFPFMIMVMSRLFELRETPTQEFLYFKIAASCKFSLICLVSG